MKKVCPSDRCSAGTADRQHEFTKGSLKRIPKAAQEIIQRETSAPRRCNYCSCVYANGGRIFGYYDSGITGKVWDGLGSDA